MWRSWQKTVKPSTRTPVSKKVAKRQEEKAMAPHSSTLAWKIPWTEGPGGLQSMGSLGVRQDWATSLSLFTFRHWKRKWQPTPVFLPGESQGWGSLVGCRLWDRRVGHDWATSLSLFTFRHWRRKWQPTPVFLPGESQGQRAWWAAVYGVAQSQIQLKRLSSSSSSRRYIFWSCVRTWVWISPPPHPSFKLPLL